MAALTGIRVLDLANSRADLAGRMLADPGAEVLKIEPSEGVDSRHMGPFDSQYNSLYWTFIGIGKSSPQVLFTALPGELVTHQLACTQQRSLTL